MAEHKDITIAIFTGSIAILGLLLVLMGLLLSSYRGLDDVAKRAGKNDYKAGITFALIAVIMSSLVILCSLLQLIGVFNLFALIAAVFMFLVTWLIVVAVQTYRLFIRSM